MAPVQKLGKGKEKKGGKRKKRKGRRKRRGKRRRKGREGGKRGKFERCLVESVIQSKVKYKFE